jgi:hypothetical protein
MINFKNFAFVSVLGLILAIMAIVIIGSIFTIMSINVIFGTNILIDVESVSAITWLTIVVGSIMKGNIK